MATLSDIDLLQRLGELAADTRRTTADLVERLIAVEDGELYRLTATMTSETRALWQEARELLGGDDAQVLAHLLKAALPGLRKPPRPTKARPVGEHPRHVPAEVKRHVWSRDGGQCAFVAKSGHRCRQRRFLEVHHVKPWMAGGPTTADNLQLRCKPHNQHEARMFFAAHRHAPDQARPNGC